MREYSDDEVSNNFRCTITSHLNDEYYLEDQGEVQFYAFSFVRSFLSILFRVFDRSLFAIRLWIFMQIYILTNIIIQKEKCLELS